MTRHNLGTFPSPRAQVPVRGIRSTSNAEANRQALKRMSELELLCGMTDQQWREFHAEQRARVFARLDEAA